MGSPDCNRSSAPGGVARTTEGREVRILLVDDHPVVRRGTRVLLESVANFTICDEASRGEEAIELATQHQPDLIIMDISMPGMPGLEAAGVIHWRFPHIPIVILSMNSGRAFVEAARHAGAQGYVSKADCASHLIRAISAVLNHQQFFPEI